MDSSEWEVVAVAADTVSADVLMGRLAAEGIRTRLQADTALLGEARQCRIQVPTTEIRRARYLLWQTRFSDDELSALAMSEGVSDAVDETASDAQGDVKGER